MSRGERRDALHAHSIIAIAVVAVSLPNQRWNRVTTNHTNTIAAIATATTCNKICRHGAVGIGDGGPRHGRDDRIMKSLDYFYCIALLCVVMG